MTPIKQFALLTLGLALAGNVLADSGRPALLDGLSGDTVQVLSDDTSAGIRGQATAYVMRAGMAAWSTALDPSVTTTRKIFDDVFVGGSATTTTDPYAWRYGYWGGAGWSNGENFNINLAFADLPADATATTLTAYLGSVKTLWQASTNFVDRMDGYFWQHDMAYLNAASLRATYLEALDANTAAQSGTAREKSRALAALKIARANLGSTQSLLIKADRALLEQLDSRYLKNWTNPATGTRMYDSSLDGTPTPDASAPTSVEYRVLRNKTVTTLSIPFSEYARVQLLKGLSARIKLNYPVSLK